MTLDSEQIARLADTLNQSGARALELIPTEAGGIRLELKPEPYLTVEAAAAYLNVSVWTVRDLVKRRILSVARPRGKRGDMRFEPAQLRRDMKRITTLGTGQR